MKETMSELDFLWWMTSSCNGTMSKKEIEEWMYWLKLAWEARKDEPDFIDLVKWCLQ